MDLPTRLKSFQKEMAIFLHYEPKQNNYIEIYKKYLELFQVEVVKTCLETSANEIFIAELIKENLILHSLSIQKKISSLREAPSIEWKGQKMSPKAVMDRLLTEYHRPIRKALFNCLEDSYRELLNPVYCELQSKYQGFSNDLHFNNYESMCFDTLKINRNNILSDLNAFLLNTDQLYFNNLKWASENRIGLGLDKLERHDAYYIWNLKDYFRYDVQHENEVFPALKNYLKKMGVRNFFENVKIKKGPPFSKSYCIPIEVPTEILLVYSSTNERQDDIRVLFHEVGHAIHLSEAHSLTNNLDPIWIDQSICEAFAFLFESLVLNKDFVSSFFGVQKDEYYFYAGLNNIYLIRYFIAKLKLEEQAMHNYESQNIVEYWKDLYSNLTGFHSTGLTAHHERDFYIRAYCYC